MSNTGHKGLFYSFFFWVLWVLLVSGCNGTRRNLGLKSWLCHMWPAWPQESHFTTLSFGLFISKLKSLEQWSPRSLTFPDERTDWHGVWENPSGTERLCVLSSLGIYFTWWNLLFLDWSFSSQAWGSAAGRDAGCMQGQLPEEWQAGEKDLQTAVWP